MRFCESEGSEWVGVLLRHDRQASRLASGAVAIVALLSLVLGFPCLYLCLRAHARISDGCEDVSALVALLQPDAGLLIGRYHGVVEIPTRAAAELGDDDVAVAQEVDVEVDVAHGRARDVDLRYVRGQERDDLGHGRHLERRADDDDEVDEVAVVLHQPLGKLVGKRLAEEGDVRLHDAGLGNVICAIVVVIVVEVAARSLGRGAVARSLALERPRASGPERRDALAASRDLARLDIVE